MTIDLIERNGSQLVIYGTDKNGQFVYSQYWYYTKKEAISRFKKEFSH